jgi:hypothetical protein
MKTKGKSEGFKIRIFFTAGISPMKNLNLTIKSIVSLTLFMEKKRLELKSDQ